MDIKICNFCGKQFDENDYINGGSIIDNLTESNYIDMCENCYHKIMPMLSHHCEIQPYMDDENDEDNI